jgi:hypothetical protein
MGVDYSRSLAAEHQVILQLDEKIYNIGTESNQMMFYLPCNIAHPMISTSLSVARDLTACA